MKGYVITFMAPRSRRHHGEPVLDVVVRIAKACGIQRHTRRTDTESIGASGRTHSAHFFELVDEPEEVAFVLENGQTDVLLEAVKTEGLHVFCMRQAVEYFQLGAAALAAQAGDGRQP